MSSVGVRELKSRLTEYLRRIKRGEEVIVTERGSRLALPTRRPLKRLRGESRADASNIRAGDVRAQRQ